jgi:histidinol-phosphate phosphatase family protein
VKQAVILAGGKGTRLASVLNGLPKPLVDVCGKPLLLHQLELLCAHGFTDAVVMVNHRADAIREWLVGVDLPISVRLIDDGEPRGTAGAVLAALDELEPEFLVMYGDTMLCVDLERFWAWHHAAPGADVSLFLHPNDHPHDSDLVEIDETGRIVAFHAYPHPANAWLPNLVNAALYVVRRESLRAWSETPGPLDFAKDLFPRMLAAGAALRGYASPEYIKDAGTPERLQRVRNALTSGAIRRASLNEPQQAVFFDRDGTLNVEYGLIRRPEDLKVFPFAGSAIRRLNEAEWRTVLVSNQPVVARGEVTEAELRHIHARLETEIGRDHAYFDRIYICPHHPDRGFPGERIELKIRCNCRKPEPGLIFNAQRDLNIDLARSWYIGDATADLGAAENAGVSGILVESGHGGLDRRYPYEARFTVANVSAAATFILEVYPKLAELLAPQIAAMALSNDWFVGGLPSAGKSTAAATLERELRLQGRRARVIHTDRWFDNDDDRQALASFDMSGLKATVAKASERAKAQSIALKLPAGRGGSLEIKLAPDEVLIWEGAFAAELAASLGRTAHAMNVVSSEAARHARFMHLCERRGVLAARAKSLFANASSEQVPETSTRSPVQINLDACQIESILAKGTANDH